MSDLLIVGVVIAVIVVIVNLVTRQRRAWQLYADQRALTYDDPAARDFMLRGQWTGVPVIIAVQRLGGATGPELPATRIRARFRNDLPAGTRMILMGFRAQGNRRQGAADDEAAANPDTLHISAKDETMKALLAKESMHKIIVDFFQEHRSAEITPAGVDVFLRGRSCVRAKLDLALQACSSLVLRLENEFGDEDEPERATNQAPQPGQASLWESLAPDEPEEPPPSTLPVSNIRTLEPASSGPPRPLGAAQPAPSPTRSAQPTPKPALPEPAPAQPPPTPAKAPPLAPKPQPSAAEPDPVTPPATGRGFVDDDFIELIAKRSLSPSQLNEAVARARGRLLRAELRIERVSPTMDMSIPDALRDGRTVVGKLSDGLQVQARFPSQENERLDALQYGDQLSLTGTVREWDDFYRQLKLDCGVSH